MCSTITDDGTRGTESAKSDFMRISRLLGIVVGERFRFQPILSGRSFVPALRYCRESSLQCTTPADHLIRTDFEHGRVIQNELVGMLVFALTRTCPTIQSSLASLMSSKGGEGSLLRIASRRRMSPSGVHICWINFPVKLDHSSMQERVGASSEKEENYCPELELKLEKKSKHRIIVRSGIAIDDHI
ncbi:hypothetical protein Tco_0520570 [Tanacetum coccineum]